MKKKWYRSRKDKMIGGVCGGIGEYFDIDPTLIRILFVVGLFMAAGFLAYIVLWIVVPEEPLIPATSNNTETTGDPGAGTGTLQDENQKPTDVPRRNRSGIFGGIMVILGVLLLIDNFVTFHAFWPLVLILIGVGILLKNRND
ncbi:MAG TPA: PspC domain-containing protein [Ignavibacteriaceae bacterium]|nr:PspC domain-containing protein [Ignavibacteriaceae bacterium]